MNHLKLSADMIRNLYMLLIVQDCSVFQDGNLIF